MKLHWSKQYTIGYKRTEILISYTKLRTTRSLRTYNYTGIATRYSYSIQCQLIRRETHAGCGYTVYISTNNLIPTYSVQVQIVTVYVLVHAV